MTMITIAAVSIESENRCNRAEIENEAQAPKMNTVTLTVQPSTYFPLFYYSTVNK